MNFLDGGGDLGVGLAAHQRHVREAFVGQDPVEHGHHVILNNRKLSIRRQNMFNLLYIAIKFCSASKNNGY